MLQKKKRAHEAYDILLTSRSENISEEKRLHMRRVAYYSQGRNKEFKNQMHTHYYFFVVKSKSYK